MCLSSLVDKCGWQVKLCDPSLTCAIPEHLTDESLVMKFYGYGLQWLLYFRIKYTTAY